MLTWLIIAGLVTYVYIDVNVNSLIPTNQTLYLRYTYVTGPARTA